MNKRFISKRTNNIALILWGLVLLSPYSVTGYGIMACSLIYFCIIFKPKITKTGIIGIAIVLISFLGNTLSGTSKIEFIDIFNSFTIILFCCTYNTVLPPSHVDKKFILLFLLIILFSQTVTALHISPFDSIITTYYHEEAYDYFNQDIADALKTGYARTGGFLGNPNQCAKFATLLLSAYLITSFRKGFNWVVIAFFIGILVLAGSRTGFLVTICIFILFVYYKADYSKIKNYKFLILGGVILTLYIIYQCTYNALSDYRFLQVDKGIDNSLMAKFFVATQYSDYLVYSHDLFSILFGRFYNSGFESLANSQGFVLGMLDSDIGNIFYSYGLIGLIVFPLLVVSKFRKEHYSPLFAIIFMWCLSASVFLHAKFFLFFIMTLMLFSNTSKKYVLQ